MHCPCCRLKWFNIQGNAIGGGVPSNWSVMGNLTRLNLASNKLQGISAHRGSPACIDKRAACLGGCSMMYRCMDRVLLTLVHFDWITVSVQF